MKMIEKIIRAMQDTGLIDGMSLEDCDTLATAALEAMGEPTEFMGRYVREFSGGVSHDSEYNRWIDAALSE